MSRIFNSTPSRSRRSGCVLWIAGVAVFLAPMHPALDLRATVKLKPVGAGAFETMGLIIRWRDPGTMTIVRVDGTPGRVWLERLQAGERSLRAGYIVPLHSDRWNILHVTAREDWLNLFLNGEFLGGVREDDPMPGRVGLMAGPGARVLLDDLEVEPMGSSAVTRGQGGAETRRNEETERRGIGGQPAESRF